MPPVEKALVIRFSSVGDILLSSLLLRVFRKRFPACRLDYLVKQQYAELVRHNPHVSNVIEFPNGGTFQELAGVKRRVGETGYDLIIDIHDSLRSRYICVGQPNVVRINKWKVARFLLVQTKLNLYSSQGGSSSVAERYLESVARFGIENDGKGLEVFFPEQAEDAAKELLGSESSSFIGLAPGAVHSTKRWTAEGFAGTAAALAREQKAGVILFGAEADIERCRAIETMITESAPRIRVLNLAGRTSLLEAAAIMDHCSIIITNDSGLMHLATARKRRVVALFGPTVKEFGFFPYGTDSVVVENHELDCRPCTHIGGPVCPKKHFRCMNDITPGHVLTAARRILGE